MKGKWFAFGVRFWVMDKGKRRSGTVVRERGGKGARLEVDSRETRDSCQSFTRVTARGDGHQPWGNERRSHHGRG